MSRNPDQHNLITCQLQAAGARKRSEACLSLVAMADEFFRSFEPPPTIQVPFAHSFKKEALVSSLTENFENSRHCTQRTPHSCAPPL